MLLSSIGLRAYGVTDSVVHRRCGCNTHRWLTASSPPSGSAAFLLPGGAGRAVHSDESVKHVGGLHFERTVTAEGAVNVCLLLRILHPSIGGAPPASTSS